MIFDFVLSIVAFLLRGITALLPSFVVFPATVPSQLSSFMSYLSGWSWIFPVSTLFTIFGILVILVLAEFIYFTAMYVLSIIHASIK